MIGLVEGSYLPVWRVPTSTINLNHLQLTSLLRVVHTEVLTFKAHHAQSMCSVMTKGELVSWMCVYLLSEQRIVYVSTKDTKHVYTVGPSSVSTTFE